MKQLSENYTVVAVDSRGVGFLTNQMMDTVQIQLQQIYLD